MSFNKADNQTNFELTTTERNFFDGVLQVFALDRSAGQLCNALEEISNRCLYLREKMIDEVNKGE